MILILQKGNFAVLNFCRVPIYCLWGYWRQVKKIHKKSRTNEL